ISRLRATCKSHASGLSGIPFVGQFSRAATSASLNASCASAMSPVRAAMQATSRPYESRATASIASYVAVKLIRESFGARGKIRTAHWAHFDKSVSRRRITRCPLQCSIQVWHVDYENPAEEFLRLGIRTVLHLPFSASDRYDRGRLGRPQTCPG